MEDDRILLLRRQHMLFLTTEGGREGGKERKSVEKKVKGGREGWR